MSTLQLTNNDFATQGTDGTEIEFATFLVGDLWLGIDIQQIQEINQHLDVAPVPRAPDCVHGVINLRGDVVTVVDLHTVLGLEAHKINSSCRNVVVNYEGEKIGLLVDAVGDVFIANESQIDPPPVNLGGVSSRFLRGVYQTDTKLFGILDTNEAMLTSAENQTELNGTGGPGDDLENN